jgi:sialidase-1
MKTIKFLISISLIIFIGCHKNETITKDTGKEIVLKLDPKEGNPRNSEGDFIALKDGGILFVYTHFTDGAGDNASAYLAGRTSKDQGETWTKKDVIILPNEAGMNIMSVSLLRLDNGDIALFYLRKNSESDCLPMMRISKDEAISWSEAKTCVEDPGYYVMNNDRVIQLENGRLIFPLSLHKTPDTEVSAMGKLICYYSDNDGENWIRSTAIENTNHVISQEPGLIELNDNKLLLFCRTESGVQYFSFSDDHGETWSPLEPGNIKSPLSPASIERIPNTGDLLLLWNNNYETGRDGGKRTPFTLAISKDEGKKWQKIKAIESNPNGHYCYTAIEFIDDHVLLGYCAGDTKYHSGLATTHITRLSLDWIYKDATPDPIVEVDSVGIIKLACSDKNAEIRYTIDGTLPSKTSLLYGSPLKIDRITNLKMQSFNPGKTPSKIVSSNIGSSVYQQAREVSYELDTGLIYQYYEGVFNLTDEIKKSTLINSGITSQFSIERSKRKTNFAFIFSGYIKIPKDGLYTFYLKTNDGSVMYLNDNKLIDNDGAHGIYERMTSTSLKEGLHKLKVEYFQQGGGSLLEIYWEAEEIPKQKIPQEVLFH